MTNPTAAAPESASKPAWTQFHDMHSGGGSKEKWDRVYIEAPKAEAVAVFFNRFGHNPSRVSCACCGEDYSITESESLGQATAYDRHCEFAWFRPDGSECERDEAWTRGVGTAAGYTDGYVERQRQQEMEIRQRCGTADDDPWGLYQALEEYCAREDVLIIQAGEIKPEERSADIPEQGYVWVE